MPSHEGCCLCRATRDYSEPAIELAGFRALVSKLQSETVNLEEALGTIVDRLMLARGIAPVDAQSRTLLLDAFALGLPECRLVAQSVDV